MEIGQKVKIKIGDEWKQGVVTCLYALPKDYDLADVEVDGETYTVQTNEVEV